MRYLLLIATNPAATGDMTEMQQHRMFAEYGEFTAKIVASGEMVSGDALEGVETATTVRVRDGKRTSTDGPFAETKEVLAGYYLVDVPDLDRAIELAAMIPDAKFGAVEVRPVLDMPDMATN